MSLVRTRSPLLVLALLLAACAKSTPTQIVVVVDSDWDGFDHLRMDIQGFEKPAPSTVQVDLTKKPLPRRLVLVHDGGPLGPLAVTVNAFVEGFSDPVLVEPRSHIFFTAGQARLMTIDLLFDCIHACGEGKACIAGAKCVSSSDAAKLVPFSNDAPTLETVFRVDAGDVVGTVMGDGGTVVVPMSADASSGSAEAGAKDAAPSDSGPIDKPDSSAAPIDAAPDGVVPTVPSFPYTPANFDPQAAPLTALGRPDVVLDCGQPTFDSSALGLTNWCGPMPGITTIMQVDGSDAAVLTMQSLTIKSGTTLKLTGTRPVILAVYGDVRIDGSIDLSAHDGAPGPGADRGCTSGSGQSGPAAGSTAGAGGGSGGGFGTAGGDGGSGGPGGSTVGGGKPEGNGSLTPLRGGCSGGHGGVVGSSSTAAAVAGGGGGALQISAAGALIVTGTLDAAGGGGGVGAAAQFGGAGGGSGGAIAIEGDTIDIQPSAILAANGGSGGAGQSTSLGGGLTSAAGADGLASASSAAGGAAGTYGGAGGDGASLAGEASAGTDGQGVITLHGGGGGGGGSVGRIAIRRAPSCGLAGIQSPLAVVECAACGTCPSSPALGCTLLEHAAKRYFRCASTASWQNARDACRNTNDELVHVHDAAENAWLASQLMADSWIGASGSNGTWTWSDDSTTLWSGGAAQGGAFTAWSSQPSNFLTNQCATLSGDGQWHEHLCSSTYAYLCQVP